MNTVLASILLLTAVNSASSNRLRGVRRKLSGYYYATSDPTVLGASNPDAALGNPVFEAGGVTGTSLESHGRAARPRLGYNFRVSKVAVAESSEEGQVAIDVTIEQTGSAPFPHSLRVVLDCVVLPSPLELDGVEALITRGDTNVFRFNGVPAAAHCLDEISLSLEAENQIKFAQGIDGTVSVSVPVPTSGTHMAWSAADTQDTQQPSADKSDTYDSFQSPDATYLMPRPRQLEKKAPSYEPKFRGDIFVDAGSSAENLALVSGDFWENYHFHSIANADPYGEEVFKVSRYGGVFTYTFSGFNPGSWQAVTLGFAENFSCGEDLRVMEIDVNNRSIVSDLDVFAKVGCHKAYEASWPVIADSQGVVAITFTSVVGAAMVAFVQLDAI